MSQIFWEQLLESIDGRLVIPILGQDLLTISPRDGRSRLLYEHLARRLAEKLNVRFPSPSPDDENQDRAAAEIAAGSLHAVASYFRAQGGDIQEVYTYLNIVVREEGAFPIPEPLRKLAEIRPFRLFVSTTFDTLLQQALDQVRFEGSPQTDVRVYLPGKPKEEIDLPADVKNLQGPLVYHLFGRLPGTAFTYALTEEDILEFIHQLQSRTLSPDGLIHELTRHHLLILGCSFPDWLARFFLRIGKGDRFSRVEHKTDYLIDSGVQKDAGLVFFLQHFGGRTKIFEGGGPIEFIDELHRRWTERHPSPDVETQPRQPSPFTMSRGAVFLSYAREDMARVAILQHALEENNLDVWLDRKDIQPGDLWELKIQSNIEKCSVFVPVLSRQSLIKPEGWFRTEWKYAVERASRKLQSRPLIVPVAIDDIPRDHPDLPKEIRAAQWAQWPADRDQFLDTVRHLFRSHDRESSSS